MITKKGAVYELFDDNPFAPDERRFEIKQGPPTHADDFLNVKWAISMIREYNRQTHRGEFILTAYPTPPYRGREQGYLTEARRRGGKASHE